MQGESPNSTAEIPEALENKQASKLPTLEVKAARKAQ